MFIYGTQLLTKQMELWISICFFIYSLAAMQTATRQRKKNPEGKAQNIFGAMCSQRFSIPLLEHVQN